ncbi:enamine deaminase RidA (YjgF/YER057c/UK114 family) [Bradyrhizobium sp. LM2.7]
MMATGRVARRCLHAPILTPVALGLREPEKRPLTRETSPQSRSEPMPRRLISTGSPFEKTAGYSRAVIDGEFAFVAGTTGYDYTTMTMPADVTSQSRNCFKSIEAALMEGGFEMADIVRATYYLTDVKDADAHFAVCGEVLGEIRPAATLVVVSALYKPEMKVEIEVTAKRRN